MANSCDFLRITETSLTNLQGRLTYIHKTENQSGTAYPSSEGVSLLLYLPRSIGAVKVSFNFYNQTQDELVYSSEAKIESVCCSEEIYKLEIPCGTLKHGLYFFDIEIDTFFKLYGVKLEDKVSFTREKHFGYKFQLTVFDEIYEKPKKNYGGIIYHIFVDRFNRGGNVPKRDDAVLIDDWYSDIIEYPEYPGAFLKNNTFYGGTLKGIEDKLDYLESLGVTTLYISPIFEAYSNHKYDTGDYSKIDAMFGGETAFRSLIEKCHARGMGIILDGVFNHTGSDSVYFNKNARYNSEGAYQSKNSPYFDWYTFKAFPDDYTSWWGIEILPRINPNVKSCADFFIKKGGIIEKYAEMGIDGFRLDVADELPDKFIAGIKAALNRKNKFSILYGEVWEDASNKVAYDKHKSYYQGYELDGVMNYPVRTGIIDFILNKTPYKLNYALTEVYGNMPKRARDAAMNLLGTHDTERILTVLSGVKANGRSNSELRDIRLSKGEREHAARRLKLAYTINATLPGIPSIYYGDEAGIEGYSDPFNRRTYPWGKEDNDLIEYYRKIGKIRRTNDAYREGEFELLALNSDKLVFKRTDMKKDLFTVANNSNRDLLIKFSSETENLVDGVKGKEFTLKPETAAIFSAKIGVSIQL